MSRPRSPRPRSGLAFAGSPGHFDPRLHPGIDGIRCVAIAPVFASRLSKDIFRHSGAAGAPGPCHGSHSPNFWSPLGNPGRFRSRGAWELCCCMTFASLVIVKLFPSSAATVLYLLAGRPCVPVPDWPALLGRGVEREPW